MDRPKYSELTGVQWTEGSPGHTRVLNEDDLSAIGLGDLGVKELRWNAENDWTIGTDLLDAHAVDVLIALGPEFQAV